MLAPNPRAVVGGNLPPGAIDFAQEASAALSDWMKDRPVIETESDARAAKLLLDRAKSSLDSMDAERDAQVRPLNEQVKAINDRYRSPRTLLEKVRNALVDRLTGYARRLEAERQRAAEEARKAAEAAAQAAREAEEHEREAREEAEAGVCDVDVGAVTERADAAFQDFQRADWAAQRAERDAKVRIGGGFGKVSTLRTVETLIITDIHAAIEDLGVTPAIADAVLSAARAYRRENSELPNGISRETERRI